MKQIYSIGVDLGTSTSEVILSRLTMEEELGPSLLPVTKITRKEVTYRSGIIFTPIMDGSRIACEQIKEFIEQALLECQITKEQIETGAVIITGESARKENAKEVSLSLSKYLGEFVVATAGPKLESVLAAYGAGCEAASKRESSRMINLDIGGGTLNAAVFDGGELTQSFAMDIGGRLIRIGSDSVVTYISDRIRFLIEDHKLSICLGKKAEKEELEKLFLCLAKSCVEVCGLEPMSEETRRLFITAPCQAEEIAGITISGGVGACFYEGQEDFLYGDCGPMLGRMLKEAFAPYRELIRRPRETIRATVIGAGSHSMNISGSTIGYEKSLLPKKNIPIVKSQVEYEQWEHLYEKTREQMAMYDEPVIGLCIKGSKSPGYKRLCVLADNILKLYEEQEGPIIVLVQEDFAKALSQVIRIRQKEERPVICLDRIFCGSGDYIDIGRPVGSAVPVVIKTLIYNS